MSINKFPKYLFYAILLGAAAATIMLAMFYGQYRWLATEIITTGSKQHYQVLQQSFERRARAEMHVVANQIATVPDNADQEILLNELNRSMLANTSLTGIRYSEGDRTIQVGEVALPAGGKSTVWLADQLIIAYPVIRNTRNAGTVFGSFGLRELKDEAVQFASALTDKEIRTRQLSYAWIGLGTFLLMSTTGLVVWLIVRRHNARIRQLKSQAEKLRHSDFGEPLPVSYGDELGELVAEFNEMRDMLRVTTISRDYVDSVLSSMNEAIIVTNAGGAVKRINKATTHLLGYGEDELVGTSVDFVVDSKKSESLLASDASGAPKEAFFETKFGESIPVSFTCSTISGNDGIPGDRVYVAQNITERRRSEQRIRYLARIDPLTKIPNRMQFQHLLQRAIAHARRGRTTLSLFYIDIDSFKEINDTFGHLAGDTTLETVAERLTAALPAETVIGRLAGDEFAVIVEGASPDEQGRAETAKVAQHVLDRLADPFFVQGHEVFMTASLGIAHYPADAPNVIDLIRNADAALYHTKKLGGNQHSFYAPQMNEAAVERLMTKSKLKRAFERDELLVHYQPKYDLETGTVCGAEALVRWELPERGLILPSDFIPLAEETNLIIEIGEWVLDKVCEDFRFWQRSVSAPGRVSVNLSLKQLRQRNFINRISSILRGYEVPPTSLELEITETTLMENPERTIRLLDDLYKLGLHLAIDDFGTGYSSLSALQQFPISTLKIDRTFVRDMATNADDATLVSTIIQMGHNLHMDVVAEGVETEDQLIFLQRMGCTFAQGLLFGDPMSSDSYLELMLAQLDGTDQYHALFA